jgi:hypothetical protein
MEVSGQLHTPADLSIEKETILPVDRRKDVSQNFSGHFTGKNKILLLSVIEPRLLRLLENLIPEMVKNEGTQTA